MSGRWLVFWLPDTSSGCSGTNIGCTLFAMFIGGSIVFNGCRHIFGLDKPSASEIQQQNRQADTKQSQNHPDNHTQQHNRHPEKHLDHPVHKISTANFHQRHHNRFRVDNYTNNSNSSDANRFHTSSHDATSHYQRDSARVRTSSDTSIGDLHSNSSTGTSASSDDSSKSSSSSTDISGGLH